MKFLLLLISLTGSIAGLSQDIDISILKLRDPATGEQVHWELCSKDSAFYKNDSLHFSSSGYSCCDFLHMIIERDRVRDIYEGHICPQPTRYTYDIEEKIKMAKVEPKDGNYFLNFYDAKGLWMSFRIVRLKRNFITKNYKKTEYFQMTLLRMK